MPLTLLLNTIVFWFLCRLSDEEGFTTWVLSGFFSLFLSIFKRAKYLKTMNTAEIQVGQNVEQQVTVGGNVEQQPIYVPNPEVREMMEYKVCMCSVVESRFYRVWAKNLSQNVTSFVRIILYFLQIISYFLRLISYFLRIYLSYRS